MVCNSGLSTYGKWGVVLDQLVGGPGHAVKMDSGCTYHFNYDSLCSLPSVEGELQKIEDQLDVMLERHNGT